MTQAQVYIGMSTQSISDRLRQHASDLRGNRHTRPLKGGGPDGFWARFDAKVICEFPWTTEPMLIFAAETVLIIMTNNARLNETFPSVHRIVSSGLNVNTMDHLNHILPPDIPGGVGRFRARECYSLTPRSFPLVSYR